MPLRGPPLSLPEYRGLLAHLWSDPVRRLGLAVSGGVDSMALAHLTHQLTKDKAHKAPKIHAFIIDHGARPSSAVEARAVAETLRSYGFIAAILPLLWRSGELSATGFETRARAARYKTLAKACMEHGVFRLLLAHHADDQAETVMMRMISGSKIDGLGGMKAVAGMPECWDIYGAKRIVVGRPFLEVGKERLKATCEHNSVPWFEDETNKDPTHTRRNAVRKLLTSYPPLLPKALQRESIVAMSKRAEARNLGLKIEALQLLRDYCDINLNTRTGTIKLTLPHNHATLWKDVRELVLMRMLIEIAEMISPSQRVETRHMWTALERVFNARAEEDIKTFTSAGLTWTYEGKQKWTLAREPFYAHKRDQITEIAPAEGWSEWKLWDGRWWIRVQTPVGKSTFVRVLRADDMQLVRAAAMNRRMKQSLEGALRELKMGMRFTVPAIYWRDGNGEAAKEILVALPTVELDFVDEAKYEIRFKD